LIRRLRLADAAGDNRRASLSATRAMRPPLTAIVLAAALTALGAAHVPAQQPVFHAAVDLVQVHAIVTDEHGDAITGLHQSDFQIFDRGHPQPIATFAEVSGRPRTRPLFPPLLPRDVADNRVAASARALVIFLIDDAFSIGPVEADPTVVNVVRHLVETVSPPVSFALATTSGRVSVEPTEDPAQIERALATINRRLGSPLPSTTKLAQMAQSLQKTDERRIVCVLIGRSEATTVAGSYPESVARALSALLQGNVVTYVVDPSGPGDDHPFADLAVSTGGFAVGTDALESGLARIAGDLDHYYLLGFYPADKADAKPHDLQVRVTRPGANIRARRRYVRAAPSKLSKGETPLMDLAWYPTPVTDLPLRLFAAPYFSAGGASSVAVALEVDAAADAAGAAPRPTDDHVGVGMMAIPVGQEKATLKVAHQLTVRLPPADAGESRSRYTIMTTLRLKPGRYQLRASAISEVAAKSGSVYLMIDVPDVRDDDVALGGVVLGGDDAVKVVDRPELTDLALPFDPTLDREFAPGATLRLFVAVRRRDPSAVVGGMITVLSSADRVVVSRPWSVGPDAAAGLDTTLPLDGLAAGAYRLLVNVADRTPRTTTLRQVGFVVR
jgi:VWFA-related protein